jgi:predicted CopG family antitoxin
MTSKTITIDHDVYEMLLAKKGHGESISRLIKRHIRSPQTARRLLERIK